MATQIQGVQEVGKVESLTQGFNQFQDASRSQSGTYWEGQSQVGTILLCNACGSFRHIVGVYKDSYENM